MDEKPEATRRSMSIQDGEMAARVARNEAAIGALRKEAGDANHRFGLVEGNAAGDRRRIDILEARAVVDREMLEELRAEGLIASDHAANLEVALRSARVIGAATGIIMVKLTVSEAYAFEMLKRASQIYNRKALAIAEEVVLTGDVSTLPTQ